MSLSSNLKSIGLHKSEIAVYLFLLRNGSQTVLNVSHGTRIARSNCYPILRSLLGRKLITKTYLESKTYFSASELSSWSDIIEFQKNTISKMMPELSAAYAKGSLKPIISFVDGAVEMNELLNTVLKSKDIILYGEEPADPEPYRLFYDRVKNSKTSGRAIVVPKKRINHYIVLWEDSLAIIPISISPFATVIQNQDIFNSFSNLIK